MEWFLLLCIGLLFHELAKIARNNSGQDLDLSKDVWYQASCHLKSCLEIQEKPLWFSSAEKDEIHEFYQDVKNHYFLDDMPRPRTKYGKASFNALSLSFARAMEKAGGNYEKQVDFAAYCHQYMIKKNTTALYDDPDSCP